MFDIPKSQWFVPCFKFRNQNHLFPILMFVLVDTNLQIGQPTKIYPWTIFWNIPYPKLGEKTAEGYLCFSGTMCIAWDSLAVFKSTQSCGPNIAVGNTCSSGKMCVSDLNVGSDLVSTRRNKWTPTN